MYIYIHHTAIYEQHMYCMYTCTLRLARQDYECSKSTLRLLTGDDRQGTQGFEHMGASEN